MAFTENLNYCMSQKGYSAYRLSKIIGSTNQAVLNWQAGKATPHAKTRQKIADHFGITLADLDGDELPVLPEQDIKEAHDPKTVGEDSQLAQFIAKFNRLSPQQKSAVLAVMEGYQPSQE